MTQGRSPAPLSRRSGWAGRERGPRVRARAGNPIIQIRAIRTLSRRSTRSRGPCVAIPPYKSGQFGRKVARQGVSPEHHQVAIPHTDQGNSDGRSSSTVRRRSSSRVAIPPYRSGQFGPLNKQEFNFISRRVQKVAIPPYRSGQFGRRRSARHHLDDRREVAIPPYRSGQFGLTSQGTPCSCDEVAESQSHHTDQGNSDNQNPAWTQRQPLYKSQSHHTDQGNSDASRGARRCDSHTTRSSQSHHTDQGNSDNALPLVPEL